MPDIFKINNIAGAVVRMELSEHGLNIVITEGSLGHPTPSPDLERVIEALNAIALPAVLVAGASGFMEAVRIVAGTLQIDPRCHVSDVLHEAGHLAIIPRRYRAQANDDLDVLVRFMLDDLDRTESEDPDSALSRAVLQCSDSEATAWAWAFGKHLGLADEQIILDSQYPDESGIPGGADVRLSLSARAYAGIHGLARAGFCSTNRFGKLPVYPELAFWTQDL